MLRIKIGETLLEVENHVWSGDLTWSAWLTEHAKGDSDVRLALWAVDYVGAELLSPLPEHNDVVYDPITEQID